MEKELSQSGVWFLRKIQKTVKITSILETASLGMVIGPLQTTYSIFFVNLKYHDRTEYFSQKYQIHNFFPRSYMVLKK